MKPVVRVPVTFPGWAGSRLWRSCREKSRDTEQRPSSCRMDKASSGKSSSRVSASKTTYCSAPVADCSDTHNRLASVLSTFAFYSQQSLRRFWILLQYVPTTWAVKFSAQPISALQTLICVVSVNQTVSHWINSWQRLCPGGELQTPRLQTWFRWDRWESQHVWLIWYRTQITTVTLRVSQTGTPFTALSLPFPLVLVNSGDAGEPSWALKHKLKSKGAIPHCHFTIWLRKICVDMRHQWRFADGEFNWRKIVNGNHFSPIQMLTPVSGLMTVHAAIGFMWNLR